MEFKKTKQPQNKQITARKKKQKTKNPALISEQSYNLKSFHQDMNMTDQVTEHLSCYTGRCLTTTVQCKSDSFFYTTGHLHYRRAKVTSWL